MIPTQQRRRKSDKYPNREVMLIEQRNHLDGEVRLLRQENTRLRMELAQMRTQEACMTRYSQGATA